MEEKTLELDIYTDENTGLQYYLVINHNELDPNGEPVIYEVTATQYAELLATQN